MILGTYVSHRSCEWPMFLLGDVSCHNISCAITRLALHPSSQWPYQRNCIILLWVRTRLSKKNYTHNPKSHKFYLSREKKKFCAIFDKQWKLSKIIHRWTARASAVTWLLLTRCRLVAMKRQRFGRNRPRKLLVCAPGVSLLLLRFLPRVLL